MIKKLLVGLLCFLLSASAVKAMDNITFGNGYIYDGAGILRFTEKQLLNVYLKDLHDKTTAGLAIVTLPTLEGQRAENRAMYINKAFQIGGYGKDNGVVLVASPRDNKIAIYAGYNVDDAIPDIRKRQVIDEVILPAFEKEFYTKGLYDGSVILIMDIANYYNKKVKGLEYKDRLAMPKTVVQKVNPIVWAIAIFLLIAGIIFYFFTKSPNVESYMGFGGDFRNLDEW